MEFIYPATIEDDGDGNLLVTFRDLPFAATEGRPLSEALNEARDCLDEAIASYMANAEDIPEPSWPRKAEYPIRLPAQTAAKAALYIAVRKTGISNAKLARRIGVNEKEIRRMLDPRHATKLPQIEMALAALGHQLSVTMETAA
jgi:antitoxin HicB